MIGHVVRDFGFDFGTCNTLIYLKGKGIVLNEPSCVAYQDRGPSYGKIVACGTKAREFVGRASEGVIAGSPLNAGVISNFEHARALMGYFLERIPQRSQLLKSRVLFGVPPLATAVEERALVEAANDVGAGEVYLVSKPLISALGIGLPVNEAYGRVIVDLGGGASTAAIVASGQVVCTERIPIGGTNFDKRIIEYVKKAKHAFIGEQSAEEIKMKLGAARMIDADLSVSVPARDVLTSMPVQLTITQAEVVQIISDPLKEIVSLVTRIIERASPEISEDIVDHGIVLTGGTSLLPEIDQLIEEKTDLPVTIVEDPISAGARGLGIMLEDWERYSRYSIAAAA